jgi:preprotein translocase SecE subunit
MWKRIREGKLVRFLIECKIETMDKASWPTRKELWAFTLVVLFALVVVAAWIGVLDTILQNITELIK